jgi:hypothetical protein
MVLEMEDLNVQMTMTWGSDWVVHQLYSAIKHTTILMIWRRFHAGNIDINISTGMPKSGLKSPANMTHAILLAVRRPSGWVRTVASGRHQYSED